MDDKCELFAFQYMGSQDRSTGGGRCKGLFTPSESGKKSEKNQKKTGKMINE